MVITGDHREQRVISVKSCSDCSQNKPHGRSYTQRPTQVTVNYSWLQARGQKHDQYSYSQLAEPLSLQSLKLPLSGDFQERHAIVIYMYPNCVLWTRCKDGKSTDQLCITEKKKKRKENGVTAAFWLFISRSANDATGFLVLRKHTANLQGAVSKAFFFLRPAYFLNCFQWQRCFLQSVTNASSMTRR